MAKLIGNAPNQVPTNADLGSMAFEDKKNYATISSPIYQPYRNIIINGDMSIAQRGTSESGITGDGYYTVDRFKLENSSSGTFTMSQSTDVPSGQGFVNSMKLDCTTADASPSYLIFSQRIEGQNLQYLKKGTANAESLTLSFWVKCNETGTMQVNIFDADNTRLICKTYTINTADTWEKKTITFAGDTTGTLDNDNARSFQLEWFLDGGATYTGGSVTGNWETRDNTNRFAGATINLGDNTSNEWYITGVQLEVGTTASDFEFLPHDVNLQRCQRYYQTIRGFVGYAISTTTIQTSIQFPKVMRAAPSVSLSGVLRISDGASNFTQSSINITQQQSLDDRWYGLFGNFTGLTQFRPVSKSQDDLFQLAAEL
jgi:hypothetical protein